MLADDSVTAQNMGRKILADAGYEVITVNNGSAALKKINEHRPDLIVLDVYMPGYSGLEVCQRLKDTGETSRIPILLTVGKLEPFKPEEAKKARADGFIVKPFEASELLSALSKLEDKVVPRGETSKTGRFARATAAVEDSRFDKSMAVEEDTGWKSRIVFPKKKEKPVEPEADDPSIYNPVNKDLRTTVENKAVDPAPAAPAQETAAPVSATAAPAAHAPAKEEQVDLGALAPAGLPKDVTPEEIAALAAAAAQMKGKLTEEPAKTSEPAPEMAVLAPAEAEAPNAEVTAEPPVAESLPAPVLESAAPAVSAATFAEETAPEKIEEPEVAASPATTSGIAAPEAETPQPPSASSGNSWSPEPPVKSEEPVTMAVATPTNAAPAVSRWTAVAVALAPEESGVSLEQEMQKAYAASAAGDGGSTAVSTAVAEAAPAPAVSAIAEPAPGDSPATVEAASAPVAAMAEAAPEAAETMSAVANAATEAISAAVAELESVAAAYVAEKAASAPAEAPVASETPSPSPVGNDAIEEKAEAKEEPVPVPEIPSPVQEAPEEAAKAEEIKETVATVEAETATPEAPQAMNEELAREESKKEGFKNEETREEELKEAAPVVETPVPVAEAPAPAVNVEDRKSDVASEISEEPAAPAHRGFRAGGLDDMAKRESETAAAWASWRKIRETGTKPAGESSLESDETSEPKDAAMAVAAGAEHNPEDAASLDADPEIASIVDSVLADMRPKIVEEIARKLGKKK